MNIERQNQLLGILRNKYAQFGKSAAPLGLQGYNDFYWDEITELAALHPEYVRYTPPNPKGNPMYETGKHDILPAIMSLPKNIGKQAAAPVDAPQVETVSDVLLQGYARQSIEKDERIAALEAERDALQLSVHGLQAQLDKAKADLSAAQAIIVQAGKDFEALRNEKQEFRNFVQQFASEELPVINAVFWQQLAKTLLIPSTPTPAQEAPATPKRPVPTRCRVNWNQRGFSSGSYEVLGFSKEKQAYCLNISSDDSRPMPKMVKMADCAVQS